MISPTKRVLEVEFRGAFCAGLGFELISKGALATVEQEESSLLVTFSLKQMEGWIVELANAYQCEVVEVREVPVDGDISAFARDFYRIDFPKLTVVPVFEDHIAAQDLSPSTVLIKPGTGFGTGHHPTTKMLLHYLHVLNHDEFSGQMAWDVGAGSGILALGFYRLFGGRIVAWESDELAVSNAFHNISLNGCEENIELRAEPFHGDISVIEPPSLIMANLYSSLLLTMESAFRSSLKSGGTLLLSGIMASEYHEVTCHYERTGWKIERASRLNDWVALMLSKDT